MRSIFCYKVIKLLNKSNINLNKQRICGVHNILKQQTNDIFSLQYCINLVEKNDYENYLCTLLLNSDTRRYAFALRAFNVEVAKSSSNVSEPTISKMRIKFWYDSIDKCYAKGSSYVEDQPVLRELKNTIDTHKLTKNYLKRLVNARDRNDQPFLTMKELEEYADNVFASLYFLLVELNGVKDLQVDHAVSHLGKAQGITTLLRAIPYIGRSQRHTYIPQEILIKHGVSDERILRDKPNDKGVEECVFEVATAAHQHLEMARKLIDKVPKQTRKILLPGIAIERYLERLRKANFRLTHQSCLKRDSLLPLSLFWANLRGKY